MVLCVDNICIWIPTQTNFVVLKWTLVKYTEVNYIILNITFSDIAYLKVKMNNNVLHIFHTTK